MEKGEGEGSEERRKEREGRRCGMNGRGERMKGERGSLIFRT